MNVNTYLPDELGERAKAAGLQFSTLLQAAVTDELERIEARSKTLAEPETYEIYLEDRNDGLGRVVDSVPSGAYTGRITGKQIGGDERHTRPCAFLTVDQRVLIYDGISKYWEADDPIEDLKILEPASEYAVACAALGLNAVIDL